MSLRVWLPLKGSLENQGLDNVIVTNNGATVVDNGKIGKCYGFDGSDDRIYANNILLNNSAMSACCWVKLSSITNNNYPYIFALGSNTSGNGIQIGLAIWKSDSKLHLVGHGAEPASNYIPPLNTWIHLCMTISGTSTKLYVNGILTDTQTNSNSPKTQNCLCIGARPNSTSGAGVSFSYPFNGYINDFRLYDHALSPLEVKQIAQGLVLHFPLDRNGWGNENLVKSTYMMPVHSSNLTGFRASGGIVSHIDYSNLPIGTGVIRMTNTGTASASVGMAEDSITGFIAGETYSQSCWVRASTSVTNFALQPIWKSSSQTTGRGGKTFTIGTSWTYIKLEGVVLAGEQASSYSTGYVYGTVPANGWIEVCGMKVEHGSRATPWCPNSADEIANFLGMNSSIEYDISGFKNNGEKTDGLTYTSDTPKYEAATHIGATSQKIHVNNFITSGFGDSYSFSWWGKRSSNSPMFWGFSNGIRLNGMYLGNLWNTGDSSNNPIYKIGTTTQVTVPSLNVWHHYVMTGNGTKCYVYLDGELWGEAKTYKAISGTSLYINGWDSGTGYSHDNMDISDFRIYCTALSAADVKELYEYNGLG